MNEWMISHMWAVAPGSFLSIIRNTTTLYVLIWTHDVCSIIWSYHLYRLHMSEFMLLRKANSFAANVDGLHRSVRLRQRLRTSTEWPRVYENVSFHLLHPFFILFCFSYYFFSLFLNLLLLLSWWVHWMITLYSVVGFFVRIMRLKGCSDVIFRD